MSQLGVGAMEKYQVIIYNSSVACTILSVAALVVNLYLLNCSRYLRRPIGVNLRLCVSLTASDAMAAFCYILTYTINVIIPNDISNCWSLLLEVIKLSTFFASVSTLLILALNHYVGIVYPLRRHIITIRSVKITIFFSYIAPFTLFLALFCVVSGGFRANVAFGFFRSDGCASSRILQNPIMRSVIVGPFIMFTLVISFLYGHIIVHMSRASKDSLLKHTTTKKKYNTKLLGTLALLAGSAVVGWLPTTVLFALICSECIFPITGPTIMYLTILSHLLNILKLLVDAFIYASRLVEIRYAMWEFHNSIIGSANGLCGKIGSTREIPPEFVKYLNYTSENRSQRRSRRINHHSVVSRSTNSPQLHSTSSSTRLSPSGSHPSTRIVTPLRQLRSLTAPSRSVQSSPSTTPLSLTEL